ncbi:hypothetical protein Mycsm_06564 (plasmid) [Mycobacterium sp. JS623]|uniref:hypothetical protein n=1 Tax=Mycobacterium sp. JS623 TaxID=212767 RepID=UPI0002A58B7B|nr:hypothetical protein [Mycobacterium sp. JS623]AGB26701.1 hypothetical protein Mycsm_06564 [Mycobacterium sp. JS623]
MTAPRTIRINRLVIEGIEPHEKTAFATAFTAELARLLREHPDSVPKGRPEPSATTPVDAAKRTAAAVHAKVVHAC